mgnify:CR=1 FL=1
MGRCLRTDADSDGTLQEEELATLIDPHHGAARDAWYNMETKLLFDEEDTDQDGQLSFDEATAPALALGSASSCRPQFENRRRLLPYWAASCATPR